MRRLALLIAAALLVGGAAVSVFYLRWHAHYAERLAKRSELVETARGPIEVARFGDDGPVVLALHGTPGGYDQTAGLGPPAVDAGFRLLAVSRPGFLRTPLEVGRTPAEQADAYAALLDALGIERVAVVGISGGGPSALQFAARHPVRCWALVDLMGVSRTRHPEEPDPTRDLQSPAVRFVFSTDFGAWLLRGMLYRNPQRILEAMLRNEAVRAKILADPEKIQRMLALADSSLVLPERRNAGSANDFEQFRSLEIPLERISAPTLVLHGTEDVNVPFAMGELVAREVPGAQLRSFPGADHFMVVSDADEVFGAMFEFLAAQRGGT